MCIYVVMRPSRGRHRRAKAGKASKVGHRWGVGHLGGVRMRHLGYKGVSRYKVTTKTVLVSNAGLWGGNESRRSGRRARGRGSINDFFSRFRVYDLELLFLPFLGGLRGRDDMLLRIYWGILRMHQNWHLLHINWTIGIRWRINYAVDWRLIKAQFLLMLLECKVLLLR